MNCGPYTVTLYDGDDCTISSDEVDTVRAARIRAREYMTDADYVDAHRAEVCDADGVCVFDLFANQVAA